MANRLRRIAPVLVATVWITLVSAPISAASPQCTNTGLRTTTCQNPGNAQIVTTPPVNPYPWGWPWGGGFVFSIGGW
ncbi:hypothetical protein [Mycobacterium sp. MMS18-G62]